MNRNAVVSNGTVFGAWALGRSIAVVGALLVITFVVINAYGLCSTYGVVRFG